MADKAKHLIEFEGETFELRTGKINGWVMAKFMDAMSDQDPDAQLPPRVLIKLVEASITKADFRRFDDLACEVGEDDEGSFWEKAWEKIIIPRLTGPVEAESDHPTGQPSDSTDGPEVILSKFAPSSDAKIYELSHGRPDRLWMLQQAAKQSRSA